MGEATVVPILLDNYLALVRNSIGSNLFRNLYAKVDGQRQDITNNGELSCAFFVSSILTILKLIKEIHLTVDSTVSDLQESGWVVVQEPKPGCVLVWEKKKRADGKEHPHIGIYIGNSLAVSNLLKQGCPGKHDWTFGSQRKVELILWNQKLTPNESNEKP